jgi:ABC-type molybdate transport system substrate-binding protein
MTSISLFSGLATKDVLEDTVLPAFVAQSGYTVDTTFEPTTVLAELIAGGARPDVVLGVGSALRQLAADDVLSPATLSPLVRSGIGLAVPPGAPAPSIATVEELVATIRSARSVAYSRTGASGAHFVHLLDLFGIAEEVNARACIIDKGFTAEALLDGRADLAVQQIIELATVDGVRIVGPLPADAQHYVELWVGAAADASPEAGSLLEFLISGTATDAYQAAGLDVTVPENPAAKRS